MEVILP